MRVRKLDRIVEVTFCQNPYDLYLALPITIPKSMVRKKAAEYIRKENLKTGKYKNGYLRIKRGRIEKTNYGNTDLTSHKELKIDYEDLRFYRCWSIPIERIEEGEEIPRQKVIKYKRIGRKKFENKQIRETEKYLNEMIEEYIKFKD